MKSKNSAANTKSNASKPSKPSNLREALDKVLTDGEKKKLITSFDIIGDIAVIDIPDELKHREKEIGEAILQVHKNIKTVCKRSGIHEGGFRIRHVEVIAGDNRTETIHRESGVVMRLDIDTVYFTPRLSHERERIAQQVKKGEVIGAFFAGVGPYPLVIAKKNPDVRIYAIELNPTAVEYLKYNINVNRAGGIIHAVCGDVKEIAPKMLGNRCDRILMPLPKGGEDFLDVALQCAKKNCIIHFYQFAPEEDLFSKAINKVEEAAKKAKKEIEIANKKMVRPYAPRVYQVVLDIKIK
jgi:tRNA (guanine37-N1)-methyltransferase